MTTSSSAFVSQKELAEAVGVTPRRVRQLVNEKIFPEPAEDGYELEKCHDRYELYSNGSEIAWNRYFDKLEADATAAPRLIENALQHEY